MLQDRFINISTVDFLSVRREAIPHVPDPENGKLRFGGELLLNGIVNRFWMDCRPQPERDVNLPLTPSLRMVKDHKEIAFIDLQPCRIEHITFIQIAYLLDSRMHEQWMNDLIGTL